jgi:hypothetical protein
MSSCISGNDGHLNVLNFQSIMSKGIGNNWGGRKKLDGGGQQL